MSPYEKISVALALVAIVVSVIALIKSTVISNKALKLSDDSLKLSHGMNELEVNSMITTTKHRVEDITLQMLPLLSKSTKSDEEIAQIAGFKQVLKSAMENNVNAYEEACAKYLDGKIDKVRFKKTYTLELRRLVNDRNHTEFFDAVRSPYKCILKVYDEWENLEK
jgi:hypothetical protein